MATLFALKKEFTGPTCEECGKEVRLVQKTPFSPTLYEYFCKHCGNTWPLPAEEVDKIPTPDETMPQIVQNIQEAVAIAKAEI